MTEYYINMDLNREHKCRGCLTVNDSVLPMTTQEKTWFQNEIPQISNTDLHICSVCRCLLRKCIRFKQQCQNASYLLQTTQDNSLTYNILQGFTIQTYNHHLDDDKCDDCSDDDIPLIMLSDDGVSMNDMKNELDDFPADIKPDFETEIQQSPKKGKRQKTLKEGFTSRMVQETDEYTVIKLTKEQVQAELRDKQASEKYKRSLYKCERCAKGFNFEDVLKSHMVKHTKESGDFKCDICSQFCPSAVSLRGHMKSHTTRYKCKVCGDVRLSRQHLLEHHAISHTSAATVYSCEHCRFTTNKRTVMQRHVRTHRARSTLACRCGATCSTRDALRAHVARHDKSKSLQCEICARRFIYPSLLQKHVQSVHVRRDYYCVECDVRFKSPDNLRLHFKKAKKHRDSSSYTQQCTHCSERFVSAASLSVHQSAAHGLPKTYCCGRCERMYSSRESLKGHIRRVHAESASHTCDVCKKTFTRKSALVTHSRLHKQSDAA